MGAWFFSFGLFQRVRLIYSPPIRFFLKTKDNLFNVLVNFREFDSFSALVFIGKTQTGTDPLGGLHSFALGIGLCVTASKSK